MAKYAYKWNTIYLGFDLFNGSLIFFIPTFLSSIKMRYCAEKHQIRYGSF